MKHRGSRQVSRALKLKISETWAHAPFALKSEAGVENFLKQRERRRDSA